MSPFTKIICGIGPLLVLVVLFMQTGYWTRIIRNFLIKRSADKQGQALMDLKHFGLINLRQYLSLRQSFGLDPKEPDAVSDPAKELSSKDDLPELSSAEVASCHVMALTFVAAPKHLQGFEQILQDNLRLTKKVDHLYKILEIRHG